MSDADTARPSGASEHLDDVGGSSQSETRVAVEASGQGEAHGDAGVSSQGEAHGDAGVSSQGEAHGDAGVSSQGEARGDAEVSGQSETPVAAEVSGQGEAHGDAGLFGPESVTWRVHAEPSLWIGGMRALFLQALHPLAMAGVAQHALFEDDWWGRLYRTGEYVGITTYGTTQEAKDVAAHVRRAHRGLKGVEPESGEKYVVADPRLLLWVHCAQVDSFLTSTRRAGLSLTDAEANQYVDEQTAAAELIGIPARMLPHDLAGLSDYFDKVRPELRATEAARSGARRLLVPPMPKRVAMLTPARPAWAMLAAIGFGSLPGWARQLYGLPALPLSDLGATVTSRALNVALRTLPESVRTGPHLRAARGRLSA